MALDHPGESQSIILKGTPFGLMHAGRAAYAQVCNRAPELAKYIHVYKGNNKVITEACNCAI